MQFVGMRLPLIIHDLGVRSIGHAPFKKHKDAFIDFLKGEEETNIDMKGKHPSAAFMHPIGDGVPNLGMCSDRESNQQPLSAQDDAPPAEPPLPVYSPHHVISTDYRKHPWLSLQLLHPSWGSLLYVSIAPLVPS